MRESSGRVGVALIAEFFVIIAGVLAALWADAWWEGRQASAYEAQLRADMVEEFRANAAILQTDLASNREVLDPLQRLIERDPAGPSVDPYLPFITIEATGYGFDPVMGVSRALVASGDLAGISDRPLRLLLAEWAAGVTEHNRRNQNHTDSYRHVTLPRLATMAGDGTWTPAEHREARILLGAQVELFVGVLETQERLLELSDRILQYLDTGSI